jgi:hypothetical protein
MAITYDSVTPDTESSAGTTTLTSGSWTITGSDRLLLGVIGTGDVSSAAHSGMDHPAAGGALTQVGSTLAVGTHANLSLWRLIAPATSANTTKGTWAGSQGEACIGGVSYTGVDQTTPVGTAVTNTGAVSATTAFSATVNVTTVVGDLVFAVAFFHEVSNPRNPAVAPAGGATGRYDIEGAQVGGWATMQCMELVATGTTTTMQADFSSALNMGGDWGIIAVVVNAAGGDTTAPVLVLPTGNPTGDSTATVGVLTDEGNGTMYSVVTTSATKPTAAQIKAGQNDGGTAAAWAGNISITSTGFKQLSATGLIPFTNYYAHLIHTDAAANDSNRVTSEQFTTNSGYYSLSTTNYV